MSLAKSTPISTVALLMQAMVGILAFLEATIFDRGMITPLLQLTRLGLA
jgi:hypothetical protein